MNELSFIQKNIEKWEHVEIMAQDLSEETPDDIADARLVDAYAALTAVGPDGPVLNEAIARVALDRSKHEFVNGLVVQRWESHIAIHSVDFP